MGLAFGARVLVTGPLAPFVEGFQAHLAERGYSLSGGEAQMRRLAHLSRWLQGEGLTPASLTPPTVARFLQARRAAGYVTALTPLGIGQVLAYLDGLGELPEKEVAVLTEKAQLLEGFRRYQLEERGLTARSVALYERVVQLFLTERSEPLREDLARLSGADISTFVLQQSGRRGVASAKTVACALRAVLRFLHVEGWTPHGLVEAVPAVAGRRENLPRALDPNQVARLLASCNRDTEVGIRDFAILTMLARLGLRSAEVAGLKLGDIDWRGGEIVIRGKGSRLDRLPLPADVGEAVVDYLRRGRPTCPCSHLFLRSCAPRAGLSRTAATSMVRAACERAGLPAVGAHRLRHGVATELLRLGAPLPEIGQLLRHQSLQTTAIYARVDRARLSGLALPWPWPGAERA